MSILKACPFCGGPVALEQPIDRPRGAFRDEWWGVVCRNTENLGGTCAIEQRPSRTREAAIERWNRRAPDPAAPPPGSIVMSKEAVEALMTYVTAVTIGRAP